MSPQTQIILFLVHHNPPTDDAVLVRERDDFVSETDVGDALSIRLYVAQIAHMTDCGVWGTMSHLKNTKPKSRAVTLILKAD